MYCLIIKVRGTLMRYRDEDKGRVFDNEKEINDAIFVYNGRFISLR